MVISLNPNNLYLHPSCGQILAGCLRQGLAALDQIKIWLCLGKKPAHQIVVITVGRLALLPDAMDQYVARWNGQFPGLTISSQLSTML